MEMKYPRESLPKPTALRQCSALLTSADRPPFVCNNGYLLQCVQTRVGRYLRSFGILDIFGQLLSHFTICSYPSSPNTPVHEMLDTKFQRVSIGDVVERDGVHLKS